MNSINGDAEGCPPHPRGVRPAGNAYTKVSNLKFNSGLFQLLPDEMIIEILELLGPDTLLKFGSTCKALFGFSRFEELWKNVIIR